MAGTARAARRRCGPPGARSKEAHRNDGPAASVPAIRLPDARQITHVTPAVGERIECDCPSCGRPDFNATYSAKYGAPEWLLGCWTAGCPGNDLGALAELVGAPDGGTLKEDPRPYLAERGHSGPGRRGGRPEALPTAAQLAGAQARLWADANALAYLRGRGLTDKTVHRAELGYAEFHGRPAAFWLPVRNGRGGLLTLKERYWPELWNGRKSRTLGGRGSHLYPALGAEQHVVLAAGELDALVTAQEFAAAGIESVAVVTPTTGTQVRDDLLEELAGRRVALVYDVGEEAAAEGNAGRLQEAGADRAWAVPLGLPNEGDDLTTWFVTYRRTADELRRLIRRAGRAGRAAR